MAERKKFDKAFKEQVVLRGMSGKITVKKIHESTRKIYGAPQITRSNLYMAPI